MNISNLFNYSSTYLSNFKIVFISLIHMCVGTSASVGCVMEHVCGGQRKRGESVLSSHHASPASVSTLGRQRQV